MGFQIQLLLLRSSKTVFYIEEFERQKEKEGEREGVCVRVFACVCVYKKAGARNQMCELIPVLTFTHIVLT